MTLRVLEEALLDHDGGTVIVTHDRAFLDRVCTGVLACEPDGRWVMYASRTQQVAAARARREPAPARVVAVQPASPRTGNTRMSYREKRELEALPAAIEGMEAEQAELSELLSDPATYRERGDEISALNERLAELNQLIESGYERWSDLEERG